MPPFAQVDIRGVIPPESESRRLGDRRQSDGHSDARSPAGTVARIRTKSEVIGQSTARSDFNMSLQTVCAASALVLAASIYGLMA
jgi:hypothetical protein